MYKTPHLRNRVHSAAILVLAMAAPMSQAWAADVSVRLYDTNNNELTGCTLVDQVDYSAGQMDVPVDVNCLNNLGGGEGFVFAPASLALDEGHQGTLDLSTASVPASSFSVTLSPPSYVSVNPATINFGPTNTAESITVTAGSVTANSSGQISVIPSVSYAGVSAGQVAAAIPVSVTDVPIDQNSCVYDGSYTWTPPDSCNSPIQKVVKPSTSQPHLPDLDRFSGSMITGKVAVLAVPVASGEVGSYLTVSLYPSEGGEDPASYQMALSRVPGSFTTTKDSNGAEIPINTYGNCVGTGLSAVTWDTWSQLSSTTQNNVCRILPGAEYYVNVQPTSAGCGSTLQCRQQVVHILPMQ